MKTSRLLLKFTLSMVAALLMGCSEEEAGSQLAQDDAQHVEMIQETLTEAITRWRYGDKAVLYDLEFEYLQNDTSFDSYLEFPQIGWMEADTVYALNVQNVSFFGRDSADVDVEVVFVGLIGDTSYAYDKYRLHYHRGRWIHPTVSVPELQQLYEDHLRVADSTAGAEAEIDDW